MYRHSHEFQCTNCSWFNYPTLHSKMNGNYTVICGHCEHKHYRHIKDGVVTEDRHNHSANHGDTVHIMRSASQKTKRKLGVIAQLRNMEAAGVLK